MVISWDINVPEDVWCRKRQDTFLSQPTSVVKMLFLTVGLKAQPWHAMEPALIQVLSLDVYSTKTINWPDAGLMLGRRRRRRPNINPALVNVSCFLGSCPCGGCFFTVWCQVTLVWMLSSPPGVSLTHGRPEIIAWSHSSTHTTTPLSSSFASVRLNICLANNKQFIYLSVIVAWQTCRLVTPVQLSLPRPSGSHMDHQHPLGLVAYNLT